MRHLNYFIAKYLAISAVLFIAGCTQAKVDKITEDARSASVQTVFHIPFLKVSFTTPLPEADVINAKRLQESLDELKKSLEEKVQQLLDETTALLREDRFEDYLTAIDVYGFEPPSKTLIPLGALIDEDGAFPDKVIVACETEKTNIREWEKEFEKDVLAISETANVSPTKAKEILSRLRSDGYSVSKEEIAASSNVRLLWYHYGWGSSYRVLDWKVEIEGTEDNIIVGYDPRGILETRPIPDKKRVHVVAGYRKLRGKFKEKPGEIKTLEKTIEDQKEEIEKLEKNIEELNEKLEKKEDKKRDISEATMWDVVSGSVKLEQFWFATAASGVYLGEIDVFSEMKGYSPWRSALYFVQDRLEKRASIVLTNAHVASMCLDFGIYVSKDKEVMYIQYPGFPFIRYTQESDYFGSPAAVLSIDQQPLYAPDLDAAIMITTPIKTMQGAAPMLGDSDNVRAGDKMVLVGNPSLLQKFTTHGVVSNTKYSILDGLMFQHASSLLEENPILYRWLKNSSFWFDAPIGTGGTSGSGVWALSGQEKGKLIALHNMGLASSCKQIMVDPKTRPINVTGGSGQVIAEYAKANKDLIDKDGYKTASYSASFDSFVKENEHFDGLVQQASCRVDVPGLNAGIPINLIKNYLQERGLDPDTFGWEHLDKSYFSK